MRVVTRPKELIFKKKRKKEIRVDIDIAVVARSDWRKR